MKNLRVLIIEDSLTVRKYMVDVLDADPDLEVIGETEDGNHAIRLCQTLRPDVITIDIVLPGLSGIEVTQQIMANCPTPILIVSSSTNRKEVLKTFDALAAGAVDVLEKPEADTQDDMWPKKLVETVKIVARIKVVKRFRGVRTTATEKPCVIPASLPRINHFEVVAIGASTGGPRAVAEILRGLQSHHSFLILLIVHLPPGYSSGLPEWLSLESGAHVCWGEDGASLPKPSSNSKTTVFMAPPDRHLIVEGGKLRLMDAPKRNFSRPSIDVLFDSVAQEYGGRAISCLLTGMGSDGAAGLLAVRRAGGLTIAQDEATSTVFGMPARAIEIGGAAIVLPISQIARKIMGLTASVGGK